VCKLCIYLFVYNEILFFSVLCTGTDTGVSDDLFTC